MYAIDWASLLTRTHRGCSACASCPRGADAPAHTHARRLPAVSGTVWALGLTSLFTDISSEMVASVLPVYLVLHLGLSPLAFGVIDGVYQGAAALVRVAAGVLADRWRRHKEIAATGYAVSAACRLLILAAGAAWSTIACVVALDRLGKGIRTAPRDALISQRTPCKSLATAFGVHRAMDAAGAMFGPILAFILLATTTNGFDVLFVASFGVAIVGVAAILLFVPSSLPNEKRIPQPAISLRSCAAPEACSRSAKQETRLSELARTPSSSRRPTGSSRATWWFSTPTARARRRARKRSCSATTASFKR